MCDTGKSECHVKTTEFTLSYIRQEHELGNDIATATEDGEEKDFTASVPTMPATTEPKEPSEKASADAVAKHELDHAQCEAQKKS